MSAGIRRSVPQIIATVIVLAACYAAVTVILSWWGVGIGAFAWGVLEGGRYRRTDRPATARASLTSAVAALIAWGGLLLWDAVRGPTEFLANMLGQLAGIPGSVVVGVTLVFVTLLAWSATAVGAFLPTAVGHFSRSRRAADSRM